MDFQSFIAGMDATTCASLRRAVEIGKFPDGRRLTADQKALCMEAVLRWEALNRPAEERTGYIDRGTKKDGESCAGDDQDHEHDHDQPLRFIDRH